MYIEIDILLLHNGLQRFDELRILNLDGVVLEGETASDTGLVSVLDLEDLDGDAVLGTSGRLGELLGRVIYPLVVGCAGVATFEEGLDGGIDAKGRVLFGGVILDALVRRRVKVGQRFVERIIRLLEDLAADLPQEFGNVFSVHVFDITKAHDGGSLRQTGRCWFCREEVVCGRTLGMWVRIDIGLRIRVAHRGCRPA